MTDLNLFGVFVLYLIYAYILMLSFHHRPGLLSRLLNCMFLT